MKKIICLGFLLSVSVFAGNVNYDASGDVFNAHNPLEGPLIIRGIVNVGESIWRAGDTVTLIQDGKYSKYEYTSNGNWAPLVLAIDDPENDGEGGGGSGGSDGSGSDGGSSGGGTSPGGGGEAGGGGGGWIGSGGGIVCTGPSGDTVCRWQMY